MTREERLEKAARKASHQIRNKSTYVSRAGRLLMDQILKDIAADMDQIADDLREAVTQDA